jgi:L-ribulose-5-phosphate 4-epimerase
MSFDDLKRAVWAANIEVFRAGLIVQTWGNVSGVDRGAGVMAIKPSGVPYDEMAPEDIVIVDLETSDVIGGSLRPSSDTPTHLHLYRAFESVGGIVHTHSTHAVAFAQSGRPIPCLGTTHADHFYGTIPITRDVAHHEVQREYEHHTGIVIVERFEGLDPLAVPAVLVAGHGPFTWGGTPNDAVKNAIVLEEVASMAMKTLQLNPDARPIDQTLLDVHYARKHGPDRYYGQES